MGAESVFTADPEAKDHQLLQGFIILFTCSAAKISADFIDLDFTGNISKY